VPGDVLVIGGGVAGLTAALAAAGNPGRAGAGTASVELIEASGSPGGAALLSAGSLWTYPDTATYLERCPGADEALAAQAVAGFPATVRWLRDRGVAVTERGPSLYGADSTFQIQPAQAVARLADLARERVTVRLGEKVTGLTRDGAWFTARTDAGRQASARTVVLATGGIHSDQDMLRAAGLGHYAGLSIRNRRPGGNGVRLAVALGARLAGTLDGIYGHLVPAGVSGGDAVSPLAAQYQSHAGVLTGLDGRLIAGPGRDDHDLNRIVAREPQRGAVLFYDTAAAPPRILKVVGGTSWAADRAAFARQHGRRAAEAGSLRGLLDAIAPWGLPAPGGQALAALASALRVPPFDAVEVEPSLTHAGAGLAVDGALEVEGAAGLFAAGQDIGRAFGDGYGGGLSLAMTTGIAAGAAAARHAAGHAVRLAPGGAAGASSPRN
jgi:glycine/D-amino acid oxidase-like deaminating enzyme